MTHVSSRLPTSVELGAVWRAKMQLEIVQNDGGFEDVNRRWEDFLREFEVGYPVSRRDSSLLAQVTDAFLATGGGEYSFDFRDWRDHQVTDEPFAIGDGATTIFPLIKSHAFGTVTHVRRIFRPVSPITLKKNGVETSSGFTVDYNLGIVTFTAAPVGGGTPDSWSWSGEFNVPVRFDKVLSSEAATIHNEHLEKFTLVEKRLRPEDFL